MKLKTSTLILLAIVLGMGTGLLLGCIIGNIEMPLGDTLVSEWIQKHAQPLVTVSTGLLSLLKTVGDLFIRLLKMIIIPLILASLVSGVVSLGDARSLGRLGLKTLTYYLCTTLLAVAVGLVLVNIVRPGMRSNITFTHEETVASQTEPPSVTSILQDIIPDNLIAATAQGDVLPIIFFAILLGVAIVSVGENGAVVGRFFASLNEVIMHIVGWIMALAPIGVFALMAHLIGTLGLSVLKPLGFYIVTVLLGLGIHAGLTLPLLLRGIARISPLRFAGDMMSAVATAFSTASSAATLPITMECLEENTGVSNKTASFVLPLGATINMDGTALYEAVAAMFIAQVYGIDLSLGQQTVIMLTATLASIGAAAIPSAGLVTMVIVLRSVNLPLEGIGMIWVVDRILDMFRTAVNVWGDSCGTAIIARLEGERF
jgi:Na+/H+-dicarboxylate symporter